MHQPYTEIELAGLGVVFDAPVDVQLTDPMPQAGVERETQRMCGEADVFRHVVKLSCSGKLGP